MATAQEILDNLKLSLNTTDDMISDLNAGVSNTNVSNLQGGALGGLVNQLVPERKPIDPALLALIGFSRMAEASSKPGATGLGAFGSGLTAGAGAYLKDKQIQEASDAKRATTAVQLAKMLGKTEADKGYQFTKDTLYNGKQYKKGDLIYFNKTEFANLDPSIQTVLPEYKMTAEKDVPQGVDRFGKKRYEGGPNKGKRVYDDDMNLINYDNAEIKIAENKELPEVVNKTVIEIETTNDVPKLPKLDLKQQETYAKREKAYYGSEQYKKYADLRANANKVMTNYDKAYTLARPQTADLAMIFAFMKMLDPRSVVREGEQQQAQGTGGLFDQLVNQYNKLLGGGSLTDMQRTSFRDLAMSYYKEGVNDLQTFNEMEVNKAPLFNLTKPVIQSYIPKIKTFDVTGYNVSIPKAGNQNKKGFVKFFKDQNSTVADIQFMLDAKNVKKSNSLKRSILDALHELYPNTKPN